MNVVLQLTFGTPKKLESAKAKEFVFQYQEKTHDFLTALCDLDKQVLETTKGILLDESSYEHDPSACVAATKNLLVNIDQTGSLPHHRVNALADFLDEGVTNIYPFMHIKPDQRNVMEELCHVVELTNSAVTLHTDTDLFELHKAWSVVPMKTRSHIGFEYEVPSS